MKQQMMISSYNAQSTAAFSTSQKNHSRILDKRAIALKLVQTLHQKSSKGYTLSNNKQNLINNNTVSNKTQKQRASTSHGMSRKARYAANGGNVAWGAP